VQAEEHEFPRFDMSDELGSGGTTRVIRTATAALAVLLLGGLASSCSLLVDSNSVQCESDAECTDRGASFAGTVCQENACVAAKVVPCETDEDCTGDMVCREDVCVQEGGQTCTTSQECINLNDGVPAACIEEACVVLVTPDCTIVQPENAIGDDNTIFFGWMGPLVGDFQSLGIPMQQSVQLALEEIGQAANGIPGASDGGRRKLAMVACHDLDPANAETPEVPASVRAATHLVENVKVPLIFGPAFSGITLDTATEITVPAGVMLLSASATSPLITGLDDNNLVWRTAPSDAIQSIPLALIVAQVEARVRTEQGLSSADDIVLAVATKGDAYGQGLFNALQDTLVFNGMSAADNGNNFVAVSYDDPADNPNFDFSAVVQTITDASPHIVLPLGTNEAITGVLLGIEAAWPTTGSPPPRPEYLLPDGGRLDELLDATKDNEDLRQRVQGTVPGRKGTIYNQFALRYKQRFGADPGTFAENAYDSGYLAAYAILAGGGDGEVSGSLMATGMMNMSDTNASNIEVGQNELNSAFNALTGGGSINFTGASGDLDFDNATGEAPSNIDIWCVVLDNTGEPVFVSSGQFFDASTGEVTGTDTECDFGPST